MKYLRLNGKEREYLDQVFSTEFRSSKGAAMMKKLESGIAKQFETSYALALVNGTATLHTALEAMGVGKNDEVIVPPLTMSATTLAVLQANATPVFADVNEETFQICASSVEKCITDRTKVIMPVALYGSAPDMDAIMALARHHKLGVIEDSAQCYWTRYKGKLVGTIGDAGSFSLQASKHLTSGEGGILVTSDTELANRMRSFSSLGYSAVTAGKAKISKKDIQDPGYERHDQLGWNYRMPELCAAVALGQLEHMEQLVRVRQQVAKAFGEVVGQCDWIRPQRITPGSENSAWAFAALLQREDISWYEFRDRYSGFGGDGIYSAWQLTYLEPMFKTLRFHGREHFISKDRKSQYSRGLCPVAEMLQPKMLQFRTNYWDQSRLEMQVLALEKTIESFN